MAGKARAAQGGGEDAFFAAVEALTWREMRSVADLIAMQLEMGGVTGEHVARSLGDAAESFLAGDDD